MRARLISMIVLSVLAASASAQELVTNGGFETGTLSGWTNTGSADALVGTSPVHTGSYSAKLSPGTSTNTLSQALLTVAGQKYDYSVWFDHESGDDFSNFVDIQWNGSSEPGFPAILQPSTGWVDYSFAVTASSTSTTISVTGHDPAGNIYVDDISVQAVPEPAPVCAMGLGLALLFRRRKAAA